MDYELGFVLYDIEGTAARCGVSTATVKRHVRVLRELGALVWKRHGTKRNLRIPGRRYAGTATIYAAVIPAAYDEAVGHRLSGVGYGARVVGMTAEGRVRAAEAVGTDDRTGDSPPVDNSPAGQEGSRDRAPHSPGPHHPVRTAETSGWSNYTPRPRAGSATASTPRAGRTRGNRPARRNPLQVARDIAVARQVRPRVAWTQHEGLRRLAYALRPLLDRGLDAHDIAAELHSWWLDWRPKCPAAYITAQLARRAEREASTAGHPPTGPSEAFTRAVTRIREAATVRTTDATDASDIGLGIDALAPAEIVQLRSAAVTDPGLVLTALAHLGERDTRRLYTSRLVDQALLQAFGGPHLAVRQAGQGGRPCA